MLLAILSAAGAVAADEIQTQFDEAVHAIENDRLRTAREILQRLLADNPSLHRARLELARVYYLSQDYDKARAEAQKVLDDPNTPPSVRTTLLAFLAQIDADESRLAERHQWTPSIYAGVLYDSNVNIGPSRDVIDTGPVNGVGTLAPDSRPKSDFAWVVSPGISHVYNPGIQFDAGEHTGNFIWQSDASAYYRGYFSENDFNLGILTLRTGPAWIVPRQWRAWVGLQGDQIWLGGDSLAFYTTLNPGVTWEVGDATELTLEGALTDRHYWDDAESGRDGLVKQAKLSATHYFNHRRLAVQGGIGYHDFDADEDRFGYQGVDLFAGVITEAWQNGIVYARADYASYDFDGTEPGFSNGAGQPLSRNDDEWRFSLGFEHDFHSGMLDRWALQGGWVYTNNGSNVDIYEYDRHVVSLGLARSF